MNKTIKVNNLQETEALATTIGHNLRGGEVIELVSDVGGGKTTFVKSLAKAAGSNDHVSSPTFTITNVYRAPKFAIYHFDFYRLQDAGVVSHELHENIHDDSDVVIVEWSDIVAHVLPEKRLKIAITATGETERQFVFDYPDGYDYLFEKTSE